MPRPTGPGKPRLDAGVSARVELRAPFAAGGCVPRDSDPSPRLEMAAEFSHCLVLAKRDASGYREAVMLAVEQLCFRFPGRAILNRTSFELRPGAVTCLLGGNGSGKTTLFNLITGFLRPEAGAIRLGERKLNGWAPFRISRMGVARTFQDLRLIGKLTVRENILLALPQHPGERLHTALLPQRLHRIRDVADNRKAEALLPSKGETQANAAGNSESPKHLGNTLKLTACVIELKARSSWTLFCFTF